MTWVKLKFAVGIGAAALLAGSVVTVAVTNATGNGERYQIDGNLVYQTSVTRNFTLTVNDCNWTIRMTGQEPQPGIKYEEVTHLNGSVYRYTFLGKPEPGGVVNSADAVIEFGDSAIEDGSFANFVWVGLASGCYYSRLTNDEVTPMFQVRDARNYRVKAHWQLNDSFPFLPKSVDYYGNVGQLPPPFDKGWKSGEVRVLSEINISGKTFPTVFTYEQFRPRSVGLRNL